MVYNFAFGHQYNIIKKLICLWCWLKKRNQYSIL
uniref:Uncharacterized protein n=1 Tax=Arundo donax TaxID=35708 RepID=A0A0A9AWU4_ARUDO